MISGGTLGLIESLLKAKTERVFPTVGSRSTRTNLLSYVPNGTTVDTNFWTTTTTGADTTVTQTNGELVVTHGGAANSTCRIVSPLVAYVPGCVHHFHAEIIAATSPVVANYNSEIGVCTANVAEKIAFYYDSGAGLNVETATPQVLIDLASMNGDPSLVQVSQQQYHPYDIYWDDNHILWLINNRLHHIAQHTTSVLTQATSFAMFISTVNPRLQSNSQDRITKIAGCSLNRFGKWNGATEVRRQRLSTAATTVICRQSGCLERLTLNRPGSASSGSLTLYDNTAGSGTIIAVINTSSSGRARTYHFGVGFQTGLTGVLTGTGTPGDVTLEFS